MRLAGTVLVLLSSLPSVCLEGAGSLLELLTGHCGLP